MLYNKHIKPSFIIIGGVKCGTSSLYRYLNKHPNILPCKTKEPGVFNTRNILKTIYKLPWYFKLFPKKEYEGWVNADWITLTGDEQFENTSFKKKKEAGVNYITGEASAAIFVKAYPWLVKKIFPNIKLIVLLRNPTERFISHYKMRIRFANEGRKNYQQISLNEYITDQLNEFNKGSQKNVLSQGIYVAHLNRWLKYFPKNVVHLCETKALDNSISAQIELNKIFYFLCLEDFDFNSKWNKYNVSKKEIEAIDEKRRLDEFYSPYNVKLYNQFGIKF